MNGWILHSGQPLPEIRRGIDEAAANKIKIELVDPKEVDLVLDPQATAILLRGAPVPLPDFVIAAFLEEPDYYNIALLRHLELLGSLCVNTAQTIQNTGDKLLTHHLLVSAGIPTPRTLLLHRGMTAGDVLRHFELPLVFKLLNGSKGESVELIHTRDELEKRLALLSQSASGQHWLAQDYIKRSHGRDLRVLVIDRKPAVGMLRQGAAGSFKSNFSLGGSVSHWPLTDEVRALAQKVIDAVGLNIGGIDLLLNDGEFLVCEANSMPGFQGIEKCCDLNVPAAIFRSIGKQLAYKRKSPFQMRAFLSAESGPLSICERLAASRDADALNYFIGLCDDPERVQRAVLNDILTRNAGSARGQALGFREITDVEGFRQRVPASDWTACADDARRMETGETDLLFEGATKHFLITSGSTGKAKYLPESDRGALAKSMTGRLRTTAIARQNPGLLEGAILPLSNSPTFGTTSAGIPIGSASGLTLAAVPASFQKRMAFPIDCYAIDKPAVLDQVIMRLALEQDVRAIITNNAARAQQLFELARASAPAFIQDIEAGSLSPELDLPADLRAKIEATLKPNPARAAELRALLADGRFSPRYYWPKLSIFSCWLAGSVGRFAAGIRNVLPETCRLFDCGYGASEGKFNIPLKPETPAAPLAIHAGFYEFIPLEGGAPLLAHELKDQTSYQLVVTNYSGLYRYDIHDIVRVDGFTGRTPNIYFETKSGEIANLAGEKISPTTVMQSFEALPSELKNQVRHYALQEGKKDHHWLCLEPKEGEVLDAERFGRLFNEAMETISTVYKLLRGQSVIQDCRTVVLRPGWQASLYARRVTPGQSTAQVKLPVILREPLDETLVAYRQAE
ncbi:MAG: alpha-L-glutamate ligase, RimK family [Rariglobus sp.]|jgi:RimK family alpha-L-glutamate ligase|nr:alpha-L-glutamate ligase, RimK family [Rariglobus sp.]